MDEGKLWSLIRNILSQGGAIQLDRASMSGYEEYSARLDAAASDRVADFAKLVDARIAELEQSVTVRDTEIARLETDLELAELDSDRLTWLLKWLAAPENCRNIRFTRPMIDACRADGNGESGDAGK